MKISFGLPEVLALGAIYLYGSALWFALALLAFSLIMAMVRHAAEQTKLRTELKQAKDQLEQLNILLASVTGGYAVVDGSTH